MTKLKLEDIHPLLDGEYEFDESYFTNRELHAIKNLTGLTAGVLEAAFSNLDNDLIVALAMVALMRAGKIASKTPWNSEEVDALWDAKTGKIGLDFSEDDARPPQMSESEGDSFESNGSSGDSSVLAGENPESVPSPTGSPD